MIQFFYLRLLHFPQMKFVAEQHAFAHRTEHPVNNANRQQHINQVSPPRFPKRRQHRYSQLTHVVSPHSILVGRFQQERIFPAFQIIVIRHAMRSIDVLPPVIKALKLESILIGIGVQIGQGCKLNAEVIIFIRYNQFLGKGRRGGGQAVSYFLRISRQRTVVNADIRNCQRSFLMGFFYLIGNKRIVSFVIAEQ